MEEGGKGSLHHSQKKQIVLQHMPWTVWPIPTMNQANQQLCDSSSTVAYSSSLGIDHLGTSILYSVSKLFQLFCREASSGCGLHNRVHIEGRAQTKGLPERAME